MEQQDNTGSVGRVGCKHMLLVGTAVVVVVGGGDGGGSAAVVEERSCTLEVEVGLHPEDIVEIHVGWTWYI